MNKFNPEKSPYATLTRNPIKAPKASGKATASTFTGRTVGNGDMRVKGGNK